MRTTSWMAMAAMGCFGSSTGAQAFSLPGTFHPAAQSGSSLSPAVVLSESYRPQADGTDAAALIVPVDYESGCITAAQIPYCNNECDNNFFKNQDGLCIRKENICPASLPKPPPLGCDVDLPGHRIPQGAALTIGSATNSANALKDGIAGRFGQGGSNDESGNGVLGFAGGPLDGDPFDAVDGVSPVTVWAEVHGSRTAFDGLADTSFDADASGALVGVDMRPDSRTLFGAAADFNRSRVETAVGETAEIATRQFGAYAGHLWDKFLATASVQGGISRGDAQSVRNPLSGSVISGDVRGYLYGGSFAGSYRFDMGNMRIEPLLGVDYLHVHQDGFTMSGAGFTDISFGEINAHVARLSLASRFGETFQLGNGTSLRWQVEAGWAHYVDSGDAETVTVQIGADAPLTVTTPGAGEDAAFCKVGVRLGLGSNTELYVDARGEERENQTSMGGAIGGKVRF